MKSNHTFLSGTISLDQLLELTPLQRHVFEEGVPYPQVLAFNNEFQLAAVIAKIPHDIATQFNNIEQILDYFRALPADQLRIGFGLIMRHIIVSDLIAITRPGQARNYSILHEIYNALEQIVNSLEMNSNQYASAEIVQPHFDDFDDFDDEPNIMGGPSLFDGSHSGKYI